jgi:16S rRNA (cytidine1402-2'-O)-methyltransferase
MSEKGSLYLIATPIGNLDDMTFRGVKTMEMVDYILAEDTRHSIKLLNHFQISKKLVSYHEHNQYTKAESIIADLEKGQNVGLVTDAGTPGISDPGSYLVLLCQERHIPYTIIPGPVAFVNALVLSGQNTNRMVFDGFLPMKNKERQKRFELLKNETRTIVFYEAPHKLKNTLKDLEKAFGPSRSVSLVRELTKRYEEVQKFTLNEANAYFAEADPKGEYVIVMEGILEEVLEEQKNESFKEVSLEDQLRIYIEDGLSKKEAIKQIAKDRGLNKRDIYTHFTNDHQSETKA